MQVLENNLLWYKIYSRSFWVMTVRKICWNCSHFCIYPAFMISSSNQGGTLAIHIAKMKLAKEIWVIRIRGWPSEDGWIDVVWRGMKLKVNDMTRGLLRNGRCHGVVTAGKQGICHVTARRHEVIFYVFIYTYQDINHGEGRWTQWM